MSRNCYKNNETNYISFLEKLQGKPVLIKTCSGLIYKTSSLEVDSTYKKIFFVDKFDHEISLDFGEILQISEVQKNGS